MGPSWLGLGPGSSTTPCVAPSLLYNKTMPGSKFEKRKKLGRPSTGVDEPIVVRLTTKMIGEIDGWAKKQSINRSEAVRLLLEGALSARSKKKPVSERSAQRASEMTGRPASRGLSNSNAKWARPKPRTLQAKGGRGKSFLGPSRTSEVGRKGTSETANY